MRGLRSALKSKTAPRSVVALLLALALPTIAGAAEIIPIEQERFWSQTERLGSQVDTETESAPDFGHFEGGTSHNNHTSDILPRELRGELNAWGSEYWNDEGYWYISGRSRYRVEFDIDVTAEYELTADLYRNEAFFGVSGAELTLSIFDPDLGGYRSLRDYAPGDIPDLIFETGTFEVGRYELDVGVYGSSTTHSAMGTVSGISHASFSLVVFDPAFPVEIDIKPRSERNLVYPLSRRLIPVALLGSEDFDVADVDVTTLAFGPDGAPPAFDLTNPWVYWLAHRDVNRDGKRDLLSYYQTAETGIAAGDSLVTCWGDNSENQLTPPPGLINPNAIAVGSYHTCAIEDNAEACLTGQTLDAAPFEGCDHIEVVSGCGRGFEVAFLIPPLVWLRRRGRSRKP